MLVTFTEYELGNEIILPNGESDGYEIVGTHEQTYEVDSDAYWQLYKESGCNTEREFEMEYEEELKSIGKRV